MLLLHVIFPINIKLKLNIIDLKLFWVKERKKEFNKKHKEKVYLLLFKLIKKINNKNNYQIFLIKSKDREVK